MNAGHSTYIIDIMSSEYSLHLKIIKLKNIITYNTLVIVKLFKYSSNLNYLIILFYN